MDVAHPIRAVIPTLDGETLGVLSRTTRELTAVEIHRLASIGSLAGIRLALNRLAEQGIVRADRRGNTIFYVANRDHIAWPAVESLANLRSIFFESLRRELANWQAEPIHASVFGSMARADGNAESDIDVLLVRADHIDEDQPPWADQVDRLRTQVLAWTGNRCQAFQIGMHRLYEYWRAGDPLVDNWVRDGITLVGPELRKILQNT